MRKSLTGVWRPEGSNGTREPPTRGETTRALPDADSYRPLSINGKCSEGASTAMARFANCDGDSVLRDVPIRDLEKVALGILAIAEEEWREALK